MYHVCHINAVKHSGNYMQLYVPRTVTPEKQTIVPK
jgi:hypothetical protein